MRWTHDCQPLPSEEELRAHRDGSMNKAETSYITHTVIPILLFKGDINHSLAAVAVLAFLAS